MTPKEFVIEINALAKRHMFYVRPARTVAESWAHGEHSIEVVCCVDYPNHIYSPNELEAIYKSYNY